MEAAAMMVAMVAVSELTMPVWSQFKEEERKAKWGERYPLISILFGKVNLSKVKVLMDLFLDKK